MNEPSKDFDDVSVKENDNEGTILVKLAEFDNSIHRADTPTIDQHGTLWITANIGDDFYCFTLPGAGEIIRYIKIEPNKSVIKLKVIKKSKAPTLQSLIDRLY